MRRGFPPGVAPAASRRLAAAAANAGVMASSKGSERRMPAPRRNLRRDNAARVETNAALLLVRRVFMVCYQWLINSKVGKKSKHNGIEWARANGKACCILSLTPRFSGVWADENIRNRFNGFIIAPFKPVRSVNPNKVQPKRE